MTEREATREKRKQTIISMFSDNKKLYTNQVAKEIGVVWTVADRLLHELVSEGHLSGVKATGYSKFHKPTAWERLKNVINV